MFQGHQLDTLTHSAIAVLAVRAAVPNSTFDSQPSKYQLLVIAAVVGAFPDVDYITALIDPLSFISNWHRSITHSLLMIPIWSIMGAAVCCYFYRSWNNYLLFSLVISIAILSHVLSDVITPWGTQVLWPLSSYKATLSTSFVIDPLMSSIVLLAVILAVSRKSQATAVIGLFVLLGYIATQATIKFQLLEQTKDYANQHQITATDFVAVPQPLAPLNWSLFIVEDTRYHVSRASLIPGSVLESSGKGNNIVSRVLSQYSPVEGLTWVTLHPYGESSLDQEFALQAWHHPDFSRFRQYADIPAVIHRRSNHDRKCVWFTDLRFDFATGQYFFVHGMCQHSNGKWLLQRNLEN